jgi:cytidine deaminase
MTRLGRPLNDQDRALIRAAQETLRRGYERKRHEVAAAVRTQRGATFVGLNLEGIHTPCAEPVALGAALTAGDREIMSMVAVWRGRGEYPVLAPCGNCRQMLLDYAPKATVLLPVAPRRIARVAIADILPAAPWTFG